MTQADLVKASQGTSHPSVNQWDQVDDFKWLRNEPSPNWSVLPAENIIPEETWREIVPGGPGWGLSDILRAVGLPSDGSNADTS